MISRFCLRHVLRFSTSSAPLDSISVSKAKSKLRAEHDPDKALEIYSSVSKHYSSPLSSRYAQELTVKRLAKSRRFDDIENLIESHKKNPKIREEHYLATLIRSYGQAGMFCHALETFQQMEGLGTPRSAISFNALLLAGVKSRMFEKVHQLFDEIPLKYGFSPDKVSYGLLVKSYCDSGLPENALQVLRDMEEKGVEVTTITFTTVLDSLYKKGEREEAESIWREMERKGCELDVGAYNVRIMNVEGEDPEKIRELIEDIGKLGLKPDAISYNYLMTAYFKHGRIEEAKKVYEELEENACNPNATTFRTLIFYLCKYEMYEQGYKVFKKSVEMHKIPDFNTLKPLAEGLMKKKKRDDVKGLIRTIRKKFPPHALKQWEKVEEDLGLNSLGAKNDKALASIPQEAEATG